MEIYVDSLLASLFSVFMLRLNNKLNFPSPVSSNRQTKENLKHKKTKMDLNVNHEEILI